MTEQELIFKLQGLKQIKPRKDWVVLSKVNLFESGMVARAVVEPAHKFNFSNILNVFYQRKLAYAFATLLFVFVGAAGLMKYGSFKNAWVASEKSSVDMVALSTLKNNVAELKAKSEILADVIKNKSQNSQVAVNEVKAAAKDLTDNIQKNPQLAKSIALEVNNSKTVLDSPSGSEGNDLRAAINNPYKVLVEQLISDEEKMTLSQDQKMVLDNVIALHNKGNDSDALVNLVLLVNSTGT